MRRGVPDIGQDHRVHPKSLANLRPPWEPGRSPNPGGRPRGASVIGPFLRDMAEGAEVREAVGEDGKLVYEVVRYGARSEEMAQVLYEVAAGKREPDPALIKALEIAIDRTDGPLVKERINTNIEVLQDVELRDRRERPAPGTETPKP